VIRRLATALILIGILLAPAAASGQARPRPRIDVVQVSGILDPTLADLVRSSIAAAEDDGAEALVLQLNSRRDVLSEQRLAELEFLVSHSAVPVAVWVGPSGARAAEGAADIALAAAVTGLASNARLEVDGTMLRAARAEEVGAADLIAPTLGDFLVGLDGRAGIEVPTSVVDEGDVPHRQPEVEVSFAKLGLTARLMHTVASPPTAYLLLIIGLCLLVFEFFTAGIGVAGVTGAGCLVLAGYGLAVLPTRPIALALLLVAIAGYAIDVQTSVPRAWTVIATAALVAGSVTLYDGFTVGWLPLVVGLAGVPLFMVAGMAGMVRTRFSTPTIGRESMIGEEGVAVAAVNPDGIVRVRDGLWRARTNRATPIAGGEPVRVAAIDGLLLEVEPLEGAARDAGH
jgi:membrane-bound serine protease (ClpP class)